MPLNDIKIRNAAPRAKVWKLSDEKGLYLQISPGGSKRWYFKYRYLGSEKKLALGAYPEVSLKVARAKRDEARAALADFRDPSQERRERKAEALLAADNTFAAIARELLSKRTKDGIAPSTEAKAQWLLSLLETDLGKRPIAEIKVPELLSVIRKVHESGRMETARRLRSFAGRVFDHAILTGRAESNPAHSLRPAFASPKVRHHPAIIDRDGLGSLLRTVDTYQGYPSTVAALKISAHLFQRPGEIRTMEWGELDLDHSRWIIPEAKTKMRRQHEVPLSRQALEIIESVKLSSDGSKFVFPAFHSKKIPLSENAVNNALRRMGFANVMTAHGFRSTASSLLNESKRWSADAIERALAHEDANAIRATYNRSSYWDERVAMHQWWSDELDIIRNSTN